MKSVEIGELGRILEAAAARRRVENTTTEARAQALVAIRSVRCRVHRAGRVGSPCWSEPVPGFCGDRIRLAAARRRNERRDGPDAWQKKNPGDGPLRPIATSKTNKEAP